MRLSGLGRTLAAATLFACVWVTITVHGTAVASDVQPPSVLAPGDPVLAPGEPAPPPVAPPPPAPGASAPPAPSLAPPPATAPGVTAGLAVEPVPPPGADLTQPRPPFYRKPWFWGAVGVAVLTGVIILVAVSASGNPKPDTTLGDMRAF
jgi:hypothetical protein